ncbi:response regulator transcription factor [Bacillus luteolus]|uniref:Response regulator transcription factor n=1 Tax=Litchfieldia luteola TaxID=682179 RepID=A0ABR9QGH6_9BACI|nr:response regulator transcription factor [Cytobacillus luteolus]MBE4907597.1 response regulator transcription factor [Cytobacillus luteolus]MBP1944372.1 DNA-binding response OmpR family regulator [Cytobacillus luteolus]
MKSILYIEDEIDIGTWVKEELESSGYEVTWLTSGDTAMEHLENTDLIILDVMLPGLDGFSLGQRFKREYPETPILMLSARIAVEDKVQGLTFADDYVTKPFHPKEIIARVEVLLRRYNKYQEKTVLLRHLEVNVEENCILDTRTNEEIILTGKQYQIFFYLLKHLNQILTKEQIYEGIWNESFIEGDKSLMVHIRHLREKIEIDPSNPTILETIRGIGYRVKK